MKRSLHSNEMLITFERNGSFIRLYMEIYSNEFAVCYSFSWCIRN